MRYDDGQVGKKVIAIFFEEGCEGVITEPSTLQVLVLPQPVDKARLARRHLPGSYGACVGGEPSVLTLWLLKK